MTWRKASVPKKNTPMRAAVLADQNEIPDNHALTVRDRVLSTDLERIVQNNVKTDTVTLDLDGEWDDCTVYVTFNDETAKSGPWSLEWKGQPLTIPSAIGAVVGPVAVSVVGYGSDGELRLVTEAAPSLLDVVRSGYVEIVDDNEENQDILSQMVAAGKKAEDAAEAANAAATSATSAASSANSAATSANSAATSANSAATKANSAAVDAQNAYETLQPYMATIDSCANVLHSEVGPDSVVTADDSFPCKPVEMTVYGQTRQNLWVNPQGSGNDITVISNSNGTVTISGTSSGNIWIGYAQRYSLKPGGTYTLSIDKATTNLNVAFRVESRHSVDRDGPSVQLAVVTDPSSPKTFTVPSNSEYCNFLFTCLETNLTVSGTYRVMLNEGSEAQPWCPPGLNSVEELSVVCAGKNLAAADLDATDDGVKISSEDDGAVSFVGTATSLHPQLWCPIYLPSDVDMVASQMVAGSVGEGGRCYFHILGILGLEATVIAATRDAEEVAFNTGEFDSYRFLAVVEGNGVTFNCKLYPQLEVGSTATAYEPPAVTTTPIDLDGHALNSLPDGTRDELHIDGGGNVTMVQRVGVANAPSEAGSWKFVYDGGEFNISDTSTSSQDDMTLRNMCDALPVRKAASDPAYAFVSTSYGYAKHPLITDASTAAGIAGGATYLYPLAAPQTIDLGTITPPTMAAPNVTAYVAGDTPAEMTLDYVRDVNIVHSRLEERVAALELASATS